MVFPSSPTWEHLKAGILVAPTFDYDPTSETDGKADGEARLWTDDPRAFLAFFFRDLDAWRTVELIAGRSEAVTLVGDKAEITAPGGLLIVSGQGAAADDLVSVEFASGTFAQGDVLYLGAASAAAPITIKHNSGSATTGGKLYTASTADVVLNALEQVVQFIYRSDADGGAGAWVQVG